jgi:Zn-dependent peptidase ImmA (M78 family)
MSDQNIKRETKRTPSKSVGLPSPSPDTSKPQLPEKLLILGIPFRVEKVKLEEDLAGETVGIYRRIQVNSDLTRRQAWSTLVHEWVHAVLHVNGVSSVIPEQVEEIIAQSIEHSLEEFLLQVGPQLLSSLDER